LALGRRRLIFSPLRTFLTNEARLAWVWLLAVYLA